jgi:Holliday junction resolvasome RuvABC endonuclease subunit
VTDDCKIFLEGYSYASNGMVFKIAEFTGLIKTRLYDMGYTTDSVPPTEWKKIITGRGNATKDIIYKHMLSNDKGMSEIISHLVADGIKYKKGCWLEDVVDSYAILKYIIQNI